MPRVAPAPGFTVPVNFKARGRLYDKASSDSGFDKASSKRFVIALQNIIAEQLLLGNQIQIPGLGTFRRGETTRLFFRNPRTGLPAPRRYRYNVVFIQCTGLKSAIN